MIKKISVLFLLVLTLTLILASCDVANKKVDSLQILSGAPTEVEVGQTPDFSAINVKVTYNDGEVKELGFSDVTISAIDTSKAGKVEYTVSYGGASAKATINVKAQSVIPTVSLDSISYLSGIKTEFYEGSDFHLTDLKVTAHYSDGSTKTVASDKITVVQNIDRDTAGEQTLIVSYEGKQLELKIKVLKIEPERFTLVLNGFDTSVLVGKSFDTSVITGTLHYNNSSTNAIAHDDITFTAVDTSTAGEKTLVGTYQGMSAECTVKVLGIKSIKFEGFKSTIKFNEELDLSSLKATVTATNDETFEILAGDIKVDKTNFNTTLDGINQKTTSISFSYLDKTETYDIKVVAERADATLLSLEYSSGAKTKIFVGEEFDDSGILATAKRTFGFNTVGIAKSSLTVSGEVNNGIAGTYPVTYSLTENGVTKSFTLNVEVVEPAPTEIQLNKTDLGFAIKGETLDTNSITATLLYDYEGKTTTLKNSDLTISSPDTSAVGKFELTVSYGGFEKKVAYEVVSVTEIKNVVGIDPIVSLGNPAYESGEVEVEILLSNDVTIERTLANGVSIDDSAYNSTAVGNTTLTVKFGDAEKVITVEVVEELDELTLLSIAIQQSSLASSIFAGDSYDYSKIKVIATFNYGITKTYEIVDGVTVTTEGTTDVAGSYTIIASYTHEGVTNTAEFTVEVKAVEAIGIEICGDYKNSILLGDSFDTSGISATLIYNNGKREPVSNNALAFAIDVSTAGKKTLTVTHKDTELTCTATVTVVGIKSVTFVGINNSYRINTTIDTADIKIVIIGDNGGTYVRNFNGNATIPTLTLDTSKANEKKAYIFTYCGVEDEIDIDVYAEFEDATLESIEYTGATQVFRNDSLLGKISVKAYYTYGFTRDYKVSDGVIVSGNTDTSSVGICNITATYGEKTAEAAINVVLPKITSIYINSAPYGIKGEEYDFDSVNVTVTFENSAVAQTATLDAFADYNILASLDVTTAGTKLLTLTANGKDYTKNVTVYEIEKIIIDTNGFNNIVQVDSEFSTDGLGKILVYLIGLQEPAIRETSQFNHNVNTAVESDTYTLTTTYLGKVSEPVKIIVAKQYFVIVGVDDPTSIADWKNGTHSDKFLDSGYQYFVGDDNPFRYKLTFSMFDIINEIPDTRDLVYEGKSTVALNGVPVGSEYVTIDEINHTFHFTSLAIGKTFEITTSHKDYPEYSKSFEVSVVDGYNVHEAIELNLLTNENSSIGKSGKNQLEVLYSFLSDNQVAGINNMSYEQYVAFVNGIRGIIIHDKLVITLSDLPDDYFFVTKNGDMYIWDHQSIYNHVFTELKLDDPKTTSVTPATFNIYGNYFTIVSNNVPTVAGSALVNDKNVASNDDDDLSSSELFFFDISNEVERIAKEQNKFYAENYVVNIYALGLHDNDPSEPVQSQLARDRSKLGIIGMKFRHGIYNLNALNMEAYFISTFPDNDDLVVNYDYCSMYNAWSNHIMTWALNSLDMTGDDKFDGAVHSGYQPITLNITNSFMGKCGGPVIITVNKSPEEQFNTDAGSKNVVNIDEKTNIFSYVKGTESWFEAYKAQPVAQIITTFNDLFKPSGASFVTNVNNNGFINMILLNMDSDFNPAGIDGVAGLFNPGKVSDIDGCLSIGDKNVLDMNDRSYGDQSFKYGHDGYIDGILANAGGMLPPIFASDLGGVCYIDGSFNLVCLNENATKGDYISLYMLGLGTLLKFNEPAINAEPKPEDCTVVRITAPHGIN